MHVISVLVLTTEYKHQNFASIKKITLKQQPLIAQLLPKAIGGPHSSFNFFFEAILISTQTLRQTHQLLLKKKKKVPVLFRKIICKFNSYQADSNRKTSSCALWFKWGLPLQERTAFTTNCFLSHSELFKKH